MSIPAYQQRVMDEAAELDSRIYNLSAFITTNSVFKILSSEEQELMEAQLDIMGSYADILLKRICLFNNKQQTL